MKKLIYWKDYAIRQDLESLVKLEKELQSDGWLDESGLLVLEQDGEDYRKQFWQKYDVTFHDDILK